MNAKPTVAVVGATGYAGRELARLVVRHPLVDRPVFFLREKGEGPDQPHCLSELYPELRGWGDAPCREFSVEAVVRSGATVAFLALPHEVSAEVAPPLVAAGLKVIDLSGAFRFHNPGTYAEWYRLPPAPADLLREAVYGLPELHSKELAGARLVANPGCYPTAVILGLKPLVDSGWIDSRRGIVCDAKSGVSGAGKQPKPETHFVEVNENFRAYGLFSHRHTPEITDQLGIDLGQMIFTTHLLPLERGILATLYVWLADRREAGEIEALYREFYAGRPLVRLWPAGEAPELRHVARTNFCDIGFALDPQGKRLVVVSCLDNLGKGAAGQAVQNMNLMCGLNETEGLL
ncbi:MAG TPA: N-acetyl-gamma-glutamyl-phosphate reductase [Candidatus Acidoferrales bacterium]|nr:N-acetyl-gamma-glutamyl-phosphate reductase [Candidatus Acidoferrales bacterium]